MGAVGRPSVAIGLLLCFSWIVTFLIRHGLPEGSQPVRWVVIGYVALQLFGYAVGYDRGLHPLEANSADRWVIFTFAMAGVALAAADGIATRRQLDRLLLALVGFGAIMAAIGALQFVGIIDIAQYKADTVPAFVELGTVDGRLVGVFIKATLKGLIWYNPHVYTLGKSGSPDNLLVNEEGLKRIDATYYKINRGGDITYHGPGQIVGYPILDLDNFFTDIHKYLRLLEEAVILTLAEYNIAAGRYPGYTGVWIDPDDDKKARKICAMGVRCSRWVTMHGLAFNVNTDLSYFGHIVPCGIKDKDVTSMQRELGRNADMEEVKARLKHHIGQLFEMKLV
jgi:lipoyl(octanoyl) transferase